MSALIEYDEKPSLPGPDKTFYIQSSNTPTYMHPATHTRTHGRGGDETPDKIKANRWNHPRKKS